MDVFYYFAGKFAVSTARSMGLVKTVAFTFSDQIICSLSLLIAMDIGYAIFHRLCHKTPWLWKLHKVHHSATSLTPITNERVHPLERLFEYTLFRFSFLSAPSFLFRSLPDGASIHGVSLAVLIFSVVPHMNHLRHSSIWLSFGPLDWILSSPCMHQIHHSSDPKHHDKNFSRIFSFIDWTMGSLYLPKQKEKLKFGVMDEEELLEAPRNYF